MFIHLTPGASFIELIHIFILWPRNGFPHGQFQQPAGPPGNMGISRPVTTGPPANNFATAPSSGRGVPLQNNFMPHQPQGLGPPSGGSSGNPPPVGPPRPPGPGQITSQMGAMNLGPQVCRFFLTLNEIFICRKW